MHVNENWFSKFLFPYSEIKKKVKIKIVPIPMNIALNCNTKMEIIDVI